MAVNGKSKGSSFERKIANLISARFESVTGIKQGWRRNPDSGSFFGASNQKRKETHDLTHAHFGDLICPDNFKYSIECKHYNAGPTFSAIVKGTITQWDKWLEQAEQDAANSKKEMMLIVKYNGIAEVVFSSKKAVDLPLIMIYKEYFIYTLSDVLTQSNDKFFDSTQQ